MKGEGTLAMTADSSEALCGLSISKEPMPRTVPGTWQNPVHIKKRLADSGKENEISENKTI